MNKLEIETEEEDAEEEDIRPLTRSTGVGGAAVAKSSLSSSIFGRNGKLVAATAALIGVVGTMYLLGGENNNNGAATASAGGGGGGPTILEPSTTINASSTSSSSARPHHHFENAYLDVPQLQLRSTTEEPSADDDYYSLESMRSRFDASKSKLFDKLRFDYGAKLFDRISMANADDPRLSLGRMVLTSPSLADSGMQPHEGGISWNRLKRKLQMKLLRVQLRAAGEPERQQGTGAARRRRARRTASTTTTSSEKSSLFPYRRDSTRRRRRRRRSRRRLEAAADDQRRKMIPFIWATGKAKLRQSELNCREQVSVLPFSSFHLYCYLTCFLSKGGHSAAAAHGNYFSESYTAVLERSLRAVFESVGLYFVGRNYAMGGTSSGPEIASCVDAVFG